MPDHNLPRIAVLVSVGRNPVSGTPRCSRNDALALDIGRALGGGVTVLHAGDPAVDVQAAGTPESEALADYLAFGAPELELLPVPEGHDIIPALAARLSGFDLILCGSRAEAGEFSGMLPYLLAARLAMPVVAGALEVSIAEGYAEILQFLPKGKRRRVRVRLPAVIAVHPMAPRRPRYAYASRVAGRVLPRPASAAATPHSTAWRTETATRKPRTFKAPETKHGHARMLAAIAAPSKGGAIISDGTAAEKAQAILAYLRDHRLIDF
jgi:electron transfer flavoprotein beta subunit